MRLFFLPQTPVFLSPLSQDTLDLFATLIVSLELSNHKQFFRTFANSFTTFALRNLTCQYLQLTLSL